VSQVGIGEVGHGSHCGEGGKRINEKDRAIVEEPEANDNYRKKMSESLLQYYENLLGS
jgi:hypothetical protein